jgi:ABC-type multidrug transport system fused ATPase/permease subunit
MNNGQNDMDNGQNDMDSGGKVVWMRLYLRLLKYVNWKLLLVVFLCLLFTVPAGLLPALIAKQITDQVFRPADDSKPVDERNRLLVIYAVLFAVVYAASSVAQFFYRYLKAVLEQSVMHDLRNKVYGNLKSLPDSFFESKGAGDAMSRNIGDVEALRNMIATFLDGAYGVLSIVGMGIILFTQEWKMAFVSLAVRLLLVPFVFLLSRAIRRNFLLARESRGVLNHFLFAKLSATGADGKMRMVENAEAEVFDERSNEFKQRNITVAKLFAVVYAAATFAVAGAGAALWLYGGRGILLGHLTLGTLVLLRGYSARFGKTLSDLSYTYAWIQRLNAPAERIFEVIDAAPEQLDA